MRNWVDLRIELECISDDKLLKGLLTKGNKYIATKLLNIGDFEIEADDTGKTRLYRRSYFKVTELIECDYCISVGDTFS